MRKAIFQILLGILLITSGACMVLLPDSFQKVVMIILGIYLILSGLKTLIAAIRFRTAFSHSMNIVTWIKLAVNIIVGGVVIYFALTHPSILMNVVIYIIAASFLFSGIIDILDAFIIMHRGFNYSSYRFDGLMSVIVSILLFMFPGFIGSVVMNLLAAIIIVIGAVMIVSSIYSIRIQRLIKTTSGKEIIGTYEELEED